MQCPFNDKADIDDILISTWIQHIWDDLITQHQCLSSVSKLSNALVAEWEQISAARFQNVMKHETRRVDAPHFRMMCSMLCLGVST